MEETIRECLKCGRELHRYNPSPFCVNCWSNFSREHLPSKPVLYDEEDVMEMMRLESKESVKRMLRRGDLPPTVPGVKKHLWVKENFDAWLKSGRPHISKSSPGQVAALARQLNAFKRAHGGLHLDSDTGEYKLGQLEYIPVMVCSAEGNETEWFPSIIPGHCE